LNSKTCAVEASMRSSLFPTSLISLPRTRFQTSCSSQSTWSIPSPSASPSLDSLPVTPDDPGATFATKRLTTNTNNCATTYYRQSITVKTDASLSMYTVMEASAMELTPSARLFADFTKPLVRKYTKQGPEVTNTSPVRKYIGDATDAEMQDDLDDCPFIRVDSSSTSSLSGRDSPKFHGHLALSGVRDSKVMDDSESWRSSFYQASRPMSIANEKDTDFSLVLNETSFSHSHNHILISWISYTLVFNRHQKWINQMNPHRRHRCWQNSWQWFRLKMSLCQYHWFEDLVRCCRCSPCVDVGGDCSCIGA
jgi:hypothetical protein